MCAQANGKCVICGDPVPSTNLNKFYCGEGCRQEGWRRHHPDEEEPYWNRVRDEILTFQLNQPRY